MTDAVEKVPKCLPAILSKETKPSYARQLIRHPGRCAAEIIGRLNKEVDAVLTDAKMQERLADLGTTMFRGSPAELGMFIVEETEKWAKVVKFSGARPE